MQNAAAAVKKTRPVVIIQNDTGNEHSPTVIVAMLTSNTDRRLYPMQFDVQIEGRGTSRVLCEQIKTVDKSRLREKIGEIEPADFWKLDRSLIVSLGINTGQDAQEGPEPAGRNVDDLLLELAGKGVSVAICPLPVWNQVNVSMVDGKANAITRNVSRTTGGIVAEIADMAALIRSEGGVA